MQKLSIVILAAGKGSRMRSQTAKVLHKICGKEMLYYIIKEAKKVSDDVTVVIAHQKEEVHKHIQAYFDDIDFIVQDVKNYPGTGGALMGIKPKYETIVVLNGDMPLIQAHSIKAFAKQKSDIVMSIFRLADPSGYGRVVIDENDEVAYVVEEKDANDRELAVKSVNAGVYAFQKDILKRFLPQLKNKNAQGEYYLTDIIEKAKKAGCSIKAINVDYEEFKGVNSKKDLAEAETIMLTRIRDKWMQEGVRIEMPHTVYIEDDVVFEGECYLEQGVRLCGDTKLKNARIKAHSVVESSTIINSDVGPLARIRPFSTIIDSHIGNFVEVKKSKLTGVKAGHLSYLGDSFIDTGTNVGAGTITCNYDGKAKYQTKIGKNVFIGSDSQLIAPLTIEDDVIIAAGTTVTSTTVPSGSLAISRLKLKFIEGFFYKFFKTKR